jgi:cell division protein FtsB
MKSRWGQGEKYLRIRRPAIEVSPRVARIVVIGLILLVTAIFIAGDFGLWNIWRAQKKLDTIRAENSVLKDGISYLRRNNSELENDPFAIERVAREKYGYMRPGERVYRIIKLESIDDNGNRIPAALDKGARSQ